MGGKSVVGEEELDARCTMLRERLREFLTWGSFNCTFDDSDGILLWNCGVQFLDGRNSQFLKLLLWKLDCINLCCIATFRSFLYIRRLILRGKKDLELNLSIFLILS